MFKLQFIMDLVHKSLRLAFIFMCFVCQIPIVLQKEADHDETGQPLYEEDGKPKYRCGFRIGGGIDQDPSKSPQGYPDKVRFSSVDSKLAWIDFIRSISNLYSFSAPQGVYITFIYEGGPAFHSGLQVHDKILQVSLSLLSEVI